MREPRLVTVLLRLPLFYNPDAQARREPVEAIYLKFIGPVETLLVTDEEDASDS